MLKCKVRTTEQALAYLLDCTMATVESMAMKKSRPPGEYNRQISIAQTGYDWAISMGVDCSDTRARSLAKHNGSVAEWARQYEAPKGSPSASAK